MTGESIEVQLARMDERFKTVLRELEKATASRKDQYAQLDEMGKSLLSIDNRVGKVEQSLAKNAPTIEEFITIKHRVVGAGVAGRWLWVGATALLAFLFSIREHLVALVSK
jgi:hypothetical protein